MLWGSRGSVVAVDIGSSAVKLIQIHGGRVVSAGVREVALRLGEGVSPRDAAVATIQDLLAETGVSARRAVGIVQGPSTAFTRLLLPRMPAKEVQQAVRWEAQKALAFPVDNAILSHHVVGEVVDRDGVTKLAVLLAAVEAQAAAEAVGTLRAAGLEPVGLTVVPAALARLARHGPPMAEPEQAWALLDVGAQVSHLIFFRGAEPLLAREIGAGGRAISEAMTSAVMVEGRRVQLDADQAERLKREVGIPSPGEAHHQVEGIPLAQIGAMIRPAVDRLVVEFQRSFAYYQERMGGPPVSRAVLSGGTAQLRNLLPFLAERQRIDVEILDPFGRLDLAEPLRDDLAAVAPRLAVAAGLALDRAHTLNLLPPEVAAARRAAWARLGVRAGVAAAAVIVAGSYGMAWQARTGTERALEVRRATLTDLQPALEVAKRLQARRDAIAPMLRAYDAVLRGGAPWHGILKELSNLTPRAVTLNEIAAMPEGHLRIKGMAFANGGAPELILADYLGKLEASPYFVGVDLIGTRQREDFDARALDFEVTARLP